MVDDSGKVHGKARRTTQTSQKLFQSNPSYLRPQQRQQREQKFLLGDVNLVNENNLFLFNMKSFSRAECD